MTLPVGSEGKQTFTANAAQTAQSATAVQSAVARAGYDQASYDKATLAVQKAMATNLTKTIDQAKRCLDALQDILSVAIAANYPQKNLVLRDHLFADAETALSEGGVEGLTRYTATIAYKILNKTLVLNSISVETRGRGNSD